MITCEESGSDFGEKEERLSTLKRWNLGEDFRVDEW
jgi:hypothetical protein